MYLTIMADYQSQECLLILILVIPKENKITDLKMMFTCGVKILWSAWPVTPSPAHLCAQEKEEQRQR